MQHTNTVICSTLVLVIVLSLIPMLEARRRYASSGLRCYEELTDSHFLYGESWKIKDFCFERSCARKKDGTLYIKTKGCPKMKPNPECKKVRRPNEMFPKCCPTFDCGKDTRVDKMSKSWYFGR
ncbi:hypothetical protein L9F63_007614 [Diploptera punctata]|uniref:Single domain-containing protein n=1 Tax=Diploptera punctata TaxID=6984 RepID=A0AAD7Z7J6_DIPPU|nr:hypothetical protein L9F63_007614 [Diploptera punctata]